MTDENKKFSRYSRCTCGSFDRPPSPGKTPGASCGTEPRAARDWSKVPEPGTRRTTSCRRPTCPVMTKLDRVKHEKQQIHGRDGDMELNGERKHMEECGGTGSD